MNIGLNMMGNQIQIIFKRTFKEDNRDGYGYLLLSNGEKYVGSFHKDLVHGSGTFYKLDGTSIEGMWINNHFVSK